MSNIRCKRQSLLTLLLLILLSAFPSTVYAGFWQDVQDCFDDFCNCNQGEKTRWETWNGQLLDRGPRNKTCAPWGKENGRDDHTCLLKKEFPGANISYYENLCAESTSASTYLEPKIRVRGQQCSGLKCWTTSKILKWDGECVSWKGGYVFPLHRMCARVANSANPEAGLPADPGYTYGKHLNYEGVTVDDTRIETIDGDFIISEAPKLCVYRDPSFFSTEDGIDVMDLAPKKQPYHKTTEVHPIAKIIIFFINNAIRMSQSPFDMISSVFDKMDKGEDGENTFGSVMSDSFEFIAQIIEWVGDAIINFLEDIGQINRAVDDTVYGCVNLPVGPMPPPFCPSLSDNFQIANVHKICHAEMEQGYPVDSTEDNQCITSQVQNTFIRNGIRVGYENLIPLCKEGEDPTVTDKCVVIDNLDLFASAKVTHATTDKVDVIPKCSGGDSNLCVRTSIEHRCSVSSPYSCTQGFRIVYGTKSNGKVTPQPYFRDDLADCDSSKRAKCQVVWGINTGEFEDIYLPFPKIQQPSQINPITRTTNLNDDKGRSTRFVVMIVRSPTYHDTYQFYQEPNQICVFSGDFVVGCTERAPIPKLQIIPCGGPPLYGLTCASDHFTPKFILGYSAYRRFEPSELPKAETTYSILEPASVYSPASFYNRINLAGTEFVGFVTDDSLITKPFSGPNSPNPSSVFGEYQYGVLPLDNQGNANEDAVHLRGLEYINDKYHLGGTYICAEPLEQTRCPEDPTMCVLTKLLNKDVVECKIFHAKSTANGGLFMCSADQTANCSIVDSMPTKSGGDIKIRRCVNGQRCYDSDKELCKASVALSDRVDPAPEEGLALGPRSYYNAKATSSYTNAPSFVAPNYDLNELTLRDKTPLELNLCSPMIKPSCQAVEAADKNSGYATWPAVKLGEISTGTCQAGWSPVNPLERRCIAVPDTFSIELEPVYQVKRNGVGMKIKDYDVGPHCKKD